MDEVGSNPTAMKWNEVGEIHEITLDREPKKRQEIDDDGKLKFFSSGDARYEWLFFGVDQNGEERTLYANWVLQKVLFAAFSTANIRQVGAGVWIKIKRIDDIPPSNPKHKPSKNYMARAEVRTAIDPAANDLREEDIPF